MGTDTAASWSGVFHPDICGCWRVLEEVPTNWSDMGRNGMTGGKDGGVVWEKLLVTETSWKYAFCMLRRFKMVLSGNQEDADPPKYWIVFRAQETKGNKSRPRFLSTWQDGDREKAVRRSKLKLNFQTREDPELGDWPAVDLGLWPSLLAPFYSPAFESWTPSISWSPLFWLWPQTPCLGHPPASWAWPRGGACLVRP